MSTAALAQDDALMVEEVVVTGIRASLERSMDIKRDSSGVVDAISAEDIGKFPDTNLAESLQRITGVSIDRVNGEGSEVTVRGFGGDNNIVTLNGRHMPSSNGSFIGNDQSGDFSQPLSRSFDFSVLASEGVNGLQVYKTGRADSPSGGLGATINVGTIKPLDSPGTQFSVGGKLLNDTSVVDGDEITPELSGLFSWTNDQESIGFSLFGSYQNRNAASVSATGNGWNIMTYRDFSDTSGDLVTEDTVIRNAPADPDQLISLPNDTRYHLAQMERERANAHATFQIKPMDSLTLTFDGFYAQNESEEQRADMTNWFNRPFDYVAFDDNPVVATTVFLRESINGVKDIGFEQQYRAMKDTMQSFGFNAEWEATDGLTLTLDAHSSENSTEPNNPNGASSTLYGMGAVVLGEHSMDLRRGDHFPVQNIIEIDDSIQGDQGDFGGTNVNGVLDAGDLGSQVLRSNTASQETTMDQVNLKANWELNEMVSLDFGFDHRVMEMSGTRVETQHVLGGWGIEQPGDINTDLIETYCLTCLFDDFNPHNGENESIAFRGDATVLANNIPEQYGEADVTGRDNNTIEEEITGLFAQASLDFEVFGLPTNVLAGVRYEETEVTSTSLVNIPSEILWLSDNDFQRNASEEMLPDTITGSYDNLLPSLDIAVNITDDLKARASYSNTIGRPGYGNLIAGRSAQTPDRPTATGAQATGSRGNPGLDPLESRNLDLSLEWYYADSSYVSIGHYEKKIENFVGTSVVDEPMFGLRDVSSGQPGTRSGDAAEQLNSLGLNRTDVNLFTMTALIDELGSAEAAAAEFTANMEDGDLPQAYVESVFARNDLAPNEDDPLFIFAVETPINTRDGRIHGMELAAQHFFGDSGFGVQANYTTVNGNVGIDVGGDPSEDQFALVGLSDTANLSLIYENYGLSTRLAWNWRDNYLRDVNRGGDRNPVFVAAYYQFDANISYDVTDNLSLTFEGINLTGENVHHYGRDKSNVWFLQELDPRYMVGARYSF